MAALPRIHSYTQGVRVLLGTTELFRFGCHTVPHVDSFIDYVPLAGPTVRYKVTAVGFSVEEQQDVPDYTSYCAVKVVAV